MAVDAAMVWFFLFSNLGPSMSFWRTSRSTGLCGCSILSMTFLIAGCGQGDGVQREHVKGVVTYQGAPVVYGTIEFVPDTNKNHSGPQGSAVIVDGKFDSSTGGQGVIPGAHIARVSAFPNPPDTQKYEDETKAPTTLPKFICLGFPLEVTIATEPLTLNLPGDADGYDSNAVQSGKRARNQP